MTATRGEFMHGLRQAFPSGISVNGDMLHISARDTTLDIWLSDMPALRIGLLNMQRLRVVIRFRSGSEAQQQATLRHMDMTMQRGGG